MTSWYGPAERRAGRGCMATRLLCLPPPAHRPLQETRGRLQRSALRAAVSPPLHCHTVSAAPSASARDTGARGSAAALGYSTALHVAGAYRRRWPSTSSLLPPSTSAMSRSVHLAPKRFALSATLRIGAPWRRGLGRPGNVRAAGIDSSRLRRTKARPSKGAQQMVTSTAELAAVVERRWSPLSCQQKHGGCKVVLVVVVTESIPIHRSIASGMSDERR